MGWVQVGLTRSPLLARTDERVRIFYGNAGPNLPASYHIIGIIFDQVYREGDVISPPARGLQTTLVPAGGSTVVEFKTPVPGVYAMVDHSLFRILKGAVGQLKVDGAQRLDIYCPVKLGSNDMCGLVPQLNLEKEYVEKFEEAVWNQTMPVTGRMENGANALTTHNYYMLVVATWFVCFVL